MPFWAVAQVQPQRESMVVEEFKNAAFTPYCPRIRIKTNGRWRTPPLFVGYVFFQVGEFWWAARWCRGVVRLLGPDGASPYHVSDTVIAEIKARERNGYVVLMKKPSKLQQGQQVRIIGGRFDGQLALFEGMAKHDRVKVLLQILGGLAVVELGQHDKVEPTQDIAVRAQV
jgi:transcription antitermination factor NusG